MGRDGDEDMAVMTRADVFWEGSRGSTEKCCPGPQEDREANRRGGPSPPPPDSARVCDSRAGAKARGEPSKAAHRKAKAPKVPVATTPGRPVAGAKG